MVHGGSQTGTNFTGTPDGREGWAQYFVRRGYAVYVVDQVARGRAAHWSQVHGPVQPVAHQFRRAALRRARALQAMAAGASAHAVAGQRQAGRSRFRSVLCIAISLARELPQAAGAQPRCARRAARQDRPGDPAHAFAIGRVRLAGRRCAAETGEGAGRGRAERAAGARYENTGAPDWFKDAERVKSSGLADLPITYDPPLGGDASSNSSSRTSPTSPISCAAGCRRSRRGKLPNLQTIPVVIIAGGGVLSCLLRPLHGGLFDPGGCAQYAHPPRRCRRPRQRPHDDAGEEQRCDCRRDRAVARPAAAARAPGSTLTAATAPDRRAAALSIVWCRRDLNMGGSADSRNRSDTGRNDSWDSCGARRPPASARCESAPACACAAWRPRAPRLLPPLPPRGCAPT